MSTELMRVNGGAVAPQQQAPGESLGMRGMMTMADMFCKSGMFGDVRDVAKAFVKIQAGRELGIPPFAAMRGVAIIQGQASLGATLVAGRMKAHGYDWTEIRRDNEVCELEIVNPKGKIAGRSRFSIDDAKLAGLVGKDNWKKYPKSMLFARCITDAARTFAPEVFSGIPVYTADELGASNTNEDGWEEPKAEPEKPQVISKGDAVEFKRMMAAFQQLKADFESLGHRSAYYDILGANGYEHANEIRPLSSARDIYREMRIRIDGLRAAKPADVIDADDRETWVAPLEEMTNG